MGSGVCEWRVGGWVNEWVGGVETQAADGSRTAGCEAAGAHSRLEGVTQHHFDTSSIAVPLTSYIHTTTSTTTSPPTAAHRATASSHRFGSSATMYTRTIAIKSAGWPSVASSAGSVRNAAVIGRQCRARKRTAR